MGHLVELIRVKGKGCLLYKQDLKWAYRQLQTDPNLAYQMGKELFCDMVLLRMLSVWS